MKESRDFQRTFHDKAAARQAVWDRMQAEKIARKRLEMRKTPRSLNLKLGLLLAWIGLLLPVLYAQDRSDSTVWREKMEKVDWMVGHWEGIGWVEMGPKGRRKLSYASTVERKLDGRVVIVDASGKLVDDGSEVHSVLRVLSYGKRSETFRWDGILATGLRRVNEAHVGQRRIQFGFPPSEEDYAALGFDASRRDLPAPPEGWMRFTISLNDKGEWVETGEMRRWSDNEWRWFQFLEIVLQPEDDRH